ncbi:UDP-glucuronic acid decarboxylase family protein [Desulfonauticus submarinus]
MDNKKILVVGGAGFIGSHLVEKLLKQGNEVVVLDNFSSGRPENLKGLDVRVIYHDIIDKITLSGFDQIYHLASLASPVFYQKYPVETALSNSVGTYNLLVEAQKHKSRILFTSTSEIYGDPLEHPQKETYWGNVNSIGIRSCYDESKRLGETLMMDFYREYGVEIRIARIFNTYGPRMRSDDGRVIPNFINQALTNKPITIYGTGRQTRSFCYVDDLVEGLIRLMNSDYVGPVNLGNPKEMTVLELAQMIKKLTNSKSKIVFKKLPKDDPTKRRPNINVAKKILKWRPKKDLKGGLKETIKYFTSVSVIKTNIKATKQ